jgi:hypothetical protein
MQNLCKQYQPPAVRTGHLLYCIVIYCVVLDLLYYTPSVKKLKFSEAVHMSTRSRLLAQLKSMALYWEMLEESSPTTSAASLLCFRLEVVEYVAAGGQLRRHRGNLMRGNRIDPLGRAPRLYGSSSAVRFDRHPNQKKTFDMNSFLTLLDGN